jgi:hypothetical protein
LDISNLTQGDSPPADVANDVAPPVPNEGVSVAAPQAAMGQLLQSRWLLLLLVAALLLLVTLAACYVQDTTPVAVVATAVNIATAAAAAAFNTTAAAVVAVVTAAFSTAVAAVQQWCQLCASNYCAWLCTDTLHTLVVLATAAALIAVVPYSLWKLRQVCIAHCNVLRSLLYIVSIVIVFVVCCKLSAPVVL